MLDMIKSVTSLEALYPALFRRFIGRDEGVIHLLGAPPWEKETFIKRKNDLETLGFPAGAREHLQELNPCPAEWASLDGRSKRLKNEETVFVITGQQPGLFSGPLYVIYKALSTVKLARYLESMLEMPVQPLFWVAGEDHNIFDLHRIYVPAIIGGPVKVRYKPSTFGPPSGAVPLKEEEVQQTLSSFERVIESGPFKEKIMALLREVSENTQTFGDWFIGVMERLFNETGLAYCDPLRMASRGLYTDLLLHVLEEGPFMHSLLDDREKELAGRGLPIQVKREGNESFIMMVWENKRFQLLRKGELFVSRQGNLAFTKVDLQKLIREEPWRFGPSVFLRPVFQDCLFPNMAYVPGPAELSYFAQIQNLYRVFGVQPPPLWPRAGLTLVEPEVMEILEGNHLSVDEVLVLAAREKRIKPVANKLNPREAEKLRLNVFPRGHPQERVMNIFPYLARYGLDFWAALVKHFPLSMGHYAFFWGEENNGA